MGFLTPRAAAPLTLALLVSLGAAQTFILDDADTLGVTKSNVVQGSFDACTADAYNKQFHHDGGENKGQSSFSFTFSVPQSGCYAVQEYHPGANLSCRQHLPQNVALKVDYCRGRHSMLTYDQSSSSKLGQWNTLGAWMFFTEEDQGTLGKLTVKNHHQETCLAGAGACTVVVDAFRVKWVGSKCKGLTLAASSPVSLPEVGEPEQPLQASQGTSQGGVQSVPEGATSMLEGAEAMLEHEGMLTLQVSGATQGQLWEMRATISSTLETHFSLTEVRIEGIRELDGRRLAGGAAAAGAAFEVFFAGRSAAAEIPDVPGFEHALQASFDEVGATAQVLSAELEWDAVYPAQSLKVSQRPNDTSDAHANVLTTIIPLVCGIGLFALVWCRCAPERCSLFAALRARCRRACAKASSEGPSADDDIIAEVAAAEAALGSKKEPAGADAQSKELAGQAEWDTYSTVSTGSGESPADPTRSERTSTSEESTEQPSGAVGASI